MRPKQTATKSETVKDKGASSSDILNYLRNQQEILEQELKTYELPIDANTLADIRKMEAIILKRQISMLKQHINAIEYMGWIYR